jgi:hypothetical protein
MTGYSQATLAALLDASFQCHVRMDNLIVCRVSARSVIYVCAEAHFCGVCHLFEVRGSLKVAYCMTGYSQATTSGPPKMPIRVSVCVWTTLSFAIGCQHVA